MTSIENTYPGMLLFLSCGCTAWRHISHPTGSAALVEVIQPCKEHTKDRIRFRGVSKGEVVSLWVKTPVAG
jgi:hypothetical protein